MSATSIEALDPRLLEHLPTIPGIAVDFVRLCDDPDAGARDVAAVAMRDPALMARILQVANSPFYAPREPVVDVGRATAILGLRSLKMIGVGFAILGELWTSTARSRELSGIIGASTMAGSAAHSFSVTMGTGRDEEALTSGLLAYLGELALLRGFQTEMVTLWDEADGMPAAEVQREAFGIDGPRLGVALMDHWHIPTDLRGGALVRTAPIDDRLARSSRVYDAALGFGTAISDLLAAKHEPALDRIKPACRAWGFTDDDLMRFWGDFRLAARRTTQQLGIDVAPELDQMIVGAKDDYMASQIAALDQLEAAQREIDQLRAENERLEGLSLQDPLTGIPNRPAFEQHLRTALASLVRRPESAPVAVALFDLDYFKQVNDGEGHVVGDELLQAIGKAACAAARTDELFARIGGDEFARVLLPESMDALEAGTERIRRAMVEAASRVGRGTATVSAGAAMVNRVGIDILAVEDQLLRGADDALYAAKRRGRDQTFVTPALSTGLVAGSLDD
ncbi:MAG: HDOD domain-containing protein [Actinomycetota bacterium]